MPEQIIADYAARLRACLDAAEPDRALVTLAYDGRSLALLRDPASEEPRPHPLAALAISLMAGALIRTGRAANARPFIHAAADLFAPSHRFYVRGTNFGDLVGAFPCIWVPGIAASIALGDRDGAVSAITRFADGYRLPTEDSEKDALTSHPLLRDLLEHPAARFHGPFRFDHAWVLDRQEEIRRLGPLDAQLEEVSEFDELFLANALVLGQPARALPLIEERLGVPAVFGRSIERDFEFNALCVLAALGRHDEAVTAAYALARHGYRNLWRFDPAAAERMWWTKATGRNEWTGPLTTLPVYQDFLRDEVIREPFDLTDPASNPLCAVREGTLGGKKRKRCWLSGKLISPGEPVVRMRRLFGHASDGDFDIVATDAFESSPWAPARRAFETDRIPLRLSFPEPRCQAEQSKRWKTPAFAAFRHDIARDPRAFDLDRAVTLIADHEPNPIRFEWLPPRTHAFDPMVNDDGHGDAVNFTWRLLKAGYGEDMFARASALPPAKADKIFALLATFDRVDCGGAAARHFGCPELPAMMERVFGGRFSLDDHLVLADFAAAQPRFRAGLAAAMRACALHLYSSYRPASDWYLQGLEHFARARCCQLLYFFVRHPEDEPVLAQAIAREWLPSGIGTGAFDAYSAATSFYHRAAVLNRMLHAPDRLEPWLKLDGRPNAIERETLRIVAQWRKSTARTRRAGRI
jgi:hypothetical protein